jgi:hypothetical protein
MFRFINACADLLQTNLLIFRYPNRDGLDLITQPHLRERLGLLTVTAERRRGTG